MPAYTHVYTSSWSGTGSPALGTEGVDWSPGYLALAYISTRTNTEVITAAAGWTELELTSEGAAGLYGRVLQTGDTTPVFTFSGGSARACQIAIFSGSVYTDLASIVAATAVRTGASSATMPYEALTVPTNDCLVIIFGKKSKSTTSNGGTPSAEPGFTEIGSRGVDGLAVSAVWNYVQQTTAANISAGDWTWSVTETAQSSGFTVALKTAAVGSSARFAAYYSMMADA